VERMKHSKGTSLWVCLGLNAFHDISARIKDRPEALELYGTISN
jgi:hypothetical protein